MLTGDAQTTFADRTLLVAQASYELCKMMTTRYPTEVSWRGLLADARKTWIREAAIQTPAPTLVPGYSGVWG